MGQRATEELRHFEGILYPTGSPTEASEVLDKPPLLPERRTAQWRRRSAPASSWTGLAGVAAEWKKRVTRNLSEKGGPTGFSGWLSFKATCKGKPAKNTPMVVKHNTNLCILRRCPEGSRADSYLQSDPRNGRLLSLLIKHLQPPESKPRPSISPGYSKDSSEIPSLVVWGWFGDSP